MTTVRSALLFAAASVCAWGQPACPSINFLVARTVNLKPTSTSHLNVLQQPFGSYTTYEVTDSAPHRVIAVTPNFERQFAACLPHDLPSVTAEAQSPVVSTSQLQASVRMSSGEFIASINGNPYASAQAIQFDVFDPQFNLLSETIFASPKSQEGFVSLALADVNRDGKPDLIGLSSAPSPPEGGHTVGALWIFAGNGDGTFQPGVSYPLPGNPQTGYASFAVADLNGDGKPDLALANDAGVTVALGKGDGTFTVLPVGAFPGCAEHNAHGLRSSSCFCCRGRSQWRWQDRPGHRTRSDIDAGELRVGGNRKRRRNIPDAGILPRAALADRNRRSRRKPHRYRRRQPGWVSRRRNYRWHHSLWRRQRWIPVAARLRFERCRIVDAGRFRWRRKDRHHSRQRKSHAALGE